MNIDDILKNAMQDAQNMTCHKYGLPLAFPPSDPVDLPAEHLRLAHKLEQAEAMLEKAGIPL